MSDRNRNQLPNNLPQLQNLIKRDPESYKEEFYQQHRHYKSNLQIFHLKPSQYSKSLHELVMFHCQIAHCYQTDLSNLPQELIELLQKHSTVLDPEMRMVFCKGLILLRNKNLIMPNTLLELFFELLRCQDKLLRKTLYSYIVQDIRSINAKHKNNKVNTSLQNFIYTMLRDSNVTAAKTSLDIMIELYRRNIWKDEKTVNVIVTACFSKVTKILVAALKFFLGSDDDDGKESDSESEDEGTTAKQVMLAQKVNKKTRKRMKQTSKALKVINKHKKKKKAELFNFSAIHLVHDPQSFAERLFKNLEGSNERFEVKLMMMNLISRLVGIHQLFLFNFYPFLQRFIQPHQKEVTKLLLYSAQASHELVPPEIIQSLIMTLVNNFVTERNSNEVMAVGLNAVREVCARCPLAMTSDLLIDLAQYKNYKNKSVMAAARSLIGLFRSVNPELLHRKDRGKPTEHSMDIQAKEYGELVAPNFIPGAEVLKDSSELQDAEREQADWESCSESGDDSDGSWHDVIHSDDDAGKDDEKEGSIVDSLTLEERQARASEISKSRLLTQEEFKEIRIKQMKREIEGAKVTKGKKRKLNNSIEEESSGEILSLNRIESIKYRPRHDKESRLATVMSGREGREKFRQQKRRHNPNASTSNKEKQKKKPFMMVKQKRNIKGKQKRSFREKQIALRDSLLKRMKNSK
ncbi:protein SDA1 homolog [Anneissia japonica]|uniref:protein SDA1 homolog n=1 Tax=Anneissia japonica TaxID=1529436 RepID=UPI00142563A0|nr:protein SDA1 homolog [Anneissia japonica]